MLPRLTHNFLQIWQNPIHVIQLDNITLVTNPQNVQQQCRVYHRKPNVHVCKALKMDIKDAWMKILKRIHCGTLLVNAPNKWAVLLSTAYFLCGHTVFWWFLYESYSCCWESISLPVLLVMEGMIKLLRPPYWQGFAAFQRPCKSC